MSHNVFSKGIAIGLSKLRFSSLATNRFHNVQPRLRFNVLYYCHKHGLPALDTKFDPRLRTFMLKIKESFDNEGFKRPEPKLGVYGIDIRHIQAVSGLAGKLLQAENELHELKSLSDDGI